MECLSGIFNNPLVECLSGIFNNPLVECLKAPVKEHFGHLISYTKYVEEMCTKMAKLNDKKRVIEEHKQRNIENCREVPKHVDSWLKDVGTTNGKVESVLNDAGNWFNFWNRYMLAMKALEITEEIKSVMERPLEWTDDRVPLGRIDSSKISTAPLSTDHEFQSRQQIFTKALEALGPNKKSHLVALCGMGGVGKTTMMKKLKEIVDQKKMFRYIVHVDIGVKTDPIYIQKVVAGYLGIDLKEEIKSMRADELRKRFNAISKGGNSKFLVILDDVWESIDLEDIGLSPLPDQGVDGVDFKVLLTSRKKDVCAEMGVEANSILNVEILTEGEAQSLFHQFVEISDLDLHMHKIGEAIVSKCGGLPIAIKTMALALRNKSKNVWKDALSGLKHRDIYQRVKKVFEMSYNNLQDEETKSVFLLCGLFPEDLDIPIEELVRYGWGLKLFKTKDTIREARYRLNTCIERLIDSNLLIGSGDVGCVKMHDLVRDFVLDMFSRVEHASIVNHGNTLDWHADNLQDSCKRLSSTCKGMSEFPRDVKFPKLLILKLMHGDKFLKFPQDFYEEMERLQVISYDHMKYPLLPTSHQCCTNLCVLHLHQCSLVFDCSSIGNLLNLEVLSFAHSGIEWLPSAIRNLKNLRLLDLTGCYGLRIDNGVLKNLFELEELYMSVGGQYRKAISLTDENCNEIAERSKNLSSLEFEFFENNAQPKNMLFEKLERFKISMGRSLDGSYSKSTNAVENTLQLVTNKGEVLESKMNELLEKTEVLCLSVADMNDLEDIEVRSFSRPPQSSSFYSLRVLVVSECAELRHLFTLGVANTLSKLEHLEVKSCDNMEELIHIRDGGEQTIMFPKLKVLSLCRLPKLSGLCDNVNIIELPQLTKLKLEGIPGFRSIYPGKELETSSLLKKEVVIPKLETLSIDHMMDLKEIWPSGFGTSGEVNVPMLRWIRVRNCDSLVNLFPSNPMPFLHHLEELTVMKCGSIEVLFDIDFNSVGEIGEHSSSSSLRSIEVQELGKLREVWRIKGADNNSPLIRGFQAVESIWIRGCKRFRNVFTPTNTNFDLGALIDLWIVDFGESRRNNESAEKSQEQNILSEEEEISEVSDSISHVVVTSSNIHSFPNLRRLSLIKYEGMDVVFEIESPTSRELVTTHYNQQRLLPNLEELRLNDLDSISHVWKCNWNKFLILQKQLSESPFHYLTTIHMFKCRSIKYLFSPLMAKLLSNLKKIEIGFCDGIEEVVSNRDDEDEENTIFTSTSIHTTTSLFLQLDSLTLEYLDNLKRIGGGRAYGGNNEISFNNTTTNTTFVDQFKFSQASGVYWSLCQYSREIEIWNCNALSSVIPWFAAGTMQKLQVLKIFFCNGMKEVFETHWMNNRDGGYDEGDGGTPGIPRLNNVIMLPNLKILEIVRCPLLEHIFTFSALGSLRQLEELTICNCQAMKVIVKEEEEDGKQTTTSSNEDVVFPRLKSIKLINLQELECFFLGMNVFLWRSLDKVTIIDCPQMMVFAPGGSTAPVLKYIHTTLGKHSLECGLNFHVRTAAHHQTLFPHLCPATSEGMLWSFHNLIEVDVKFIDDEKIIPSNELLQLQKLEKIHLEYCPKVEEVFEALEGGTNSSGFDESETTVVKLPNLTQVELENLDDMRYIWKSNQRTLFEFSNLTRVDIKKCEKLEHVFTSSMISSLFQLQELHIKECKNMEELLVKAENAVQSEEREKCDGKTKKFTLPRLKSLTLDFLPHLKGFYLGKEDLSFPLLDTLIIKRCQAITIFTEGNSITPQLKEIETSFGSFDARGDINSFIKIKQEEFEKDYDFKKDYDSYQN